MGWNHFEFEKEIEVDIDVNVDLDVKIEFEKEVDVDIKVDSDVDVKGNLTSVSVDAEAYGNNSLVEIDATVLTTDYLSSAYLSIIAAVDLSASASGDSADCRWLRGPVGHKPSGPHSTNEGAARVVSRPKRVVRHVHLGEIQHNARSSRDRGHHFGQRRRNERDGHVRGRRPLHRKHR